MQFKPLVKGDVKRPFLIAGPCSAESKQQVMETARALATQPINLFRAGIWKPRTRPDSFEGVGAIGLKWLGQVQRELDMKVAVEVANSYHVEEALRHKVDVLWIGARTTANPFSVQEIADALQGVEVPVMVKNPVNPDLSLWIGAIERIHKAGIGQLAAIHRGFSSFGNAKYRNPPRWQIPIELKRHFPELLLICDHSHICGRRDMLQGVAQIAMDLQFDGLMTEIHPQPDAAWSDARQQIAPLDYKELIGRLVFRKSSSTDAQFLKSLEHLRDRIDQLDEELLNLLGSRMQLADSIGQYKKQNNISIYQPERWTQIRQLAFAKGPGLALSDEFIDQLLKAIHQESINHQQEVMNRQEEDSSAPKG